MKTGSAKLNFLCNFTQLPMCKISLFTVLFTADVSFFSCFLVGDLCRSACRQNCHPPPPLPFALYPIGVKFGPGYTPLNFSSRGDSKGSQPISVLQLLSKGSLPEDIIKSNEGASLTIC